MWKAVFAVVVMSTVAMAEQAPGSHNAQATSVPLTQTQSQAAPDNSASLFLKLNSCLAQRPGTGSSLDDVLKKANTR